jgi:uncharacterized protein (DUF1778 family)
MCADFREGSQFRPSRYADLRMASVHRALFNGRMKKHLSRSEKRSVSVRFSEAERSLIDTAAASRGCSRTAFVRDAALEAANIAVLEPGVIRISPEAFREIQVALDAPPVAVPDIVRLMQRKAPWET